MAGNLVQRLPLGPRGNCLGLQDPLLKLRLFDAVVRP